MEKVLINKNLLVLHLRHFFFVVFIAGIAIFICIYQKESFRNSSQTPHLLRSSQKQTQHKNMVPFKATFVVTQEVVHTSTFAAGSGRFVLAAGTFRITANGIICVPEGINNFNGTITY